MAQGTPCRPKTFAGGLLLAALLLAGCTGFGPDPEVWDSMHGCVTASDEHDQVTVCSYGDSQPDDKPQTFSCSAEWKHNGSFEFKDSATCDPFTRTEKIVPNLVGVLTWTVDEGGCKLRIETPTGHFLKASAQCIGVDRGGFQ